MHSLLRSEHTPGRRVGDRSGGGPIGLVVVQLAQALGAPSCRHLGLNPFRRALAERWGAVTFSPTTRWSRGAASRHLIAEASTSASSAAVRQVHSRL